MRLLTELCMRFLGCVWGRPSTRFRDGDPAFSGGGLWAVEVCVSGGVEFVVRSWTCESRRFFSLIDIVWESLSWGSVPPVSKNVQSRGSMAILLWEFSRVLGLEGKCLEGMRVYESAGELRAFASWMGPITQFPLRQVELSRSPVWRPIGQAIWCFDSLASRDVRKQHYTCILEIDAWANYINSDADPGS